MTPPNKSNVSNQSKIVNVLLDNFVRQFTATFFGHLFDSFSKFVMLPMFWAVQEFAHYKKRRRGAGEVSLSRMFPLFGSLKDATGKTPVMTLRGKEPENSRLSVLHLCFIFVCTIPMTSFWQNTSTKAYHRGTKPLGPVSGKRDFLCGYYFEPSDVLWILSLEVLVPRFRGEECPPSTQKGKSPSKIQDVYNSFRAGPNGYPQKGYRQKGQFSHFFRGGVCKLVQRHADRPLC